jgi:hypothetical protein
MMGRQRRPSTEDIRAQAEWEREVDAVTLEQACAVITTAWHHRRRDPTSWRLVAHQVAYVARQEQRAREGA